MSFTPRYNVPEAGNSYYTLTSYGGLNECILGSPAAWQGSALANCVGYTWGRAYEVMGSRPTLSRGNGATWYNYNDGYSRGYEPRAGGIMCYGGGSQGAGHVAFVEAVENGIVKTSNSGYGNSIFYLQNYNIGSYAMSGYVYQGCIYLPIESGSSGKKQKYFFLWEMGKNGIFKTRK